MAPKFEVKLGLTGESNRPVSLSFRVLISGSKSIEKVVTFLYNDCRVLQASDQGFQVFVVDAPALSSEVERGSNVACPLSELFGRQLDEHSPGVDLPAQHDVDFRRSAFGQGLFEGEHGVSWQRFMFAKWATDELEGE